MRLFFTILLNDEVKIALQNLQEQLKAQVYKGSFTRPENFHLTLAFLGEIPESRVMALHQIIQKINFLSFEITFNRTSCFTHSRKELWWTGVDPYDPLLPNLKSIHEQLIKRLEKNDFSVDKKPFNAHITLGREIRHSQPIVLNCQEIKVMVDRIRLMKSERIGGVLTYTEMFA